MFRFPLFLLLFLIISAGCSKIQLPVASDSSALLTAEQEISELKQPAGFESSTQELYASTDFLISDLDETIFQQEKSVADDVPSRSFNQIKEDKDSTEVVQIFEPLVLGGTATAVAGAALGLIGLTAGTALLLAGASLLIVSAILTMIGWKRIKKDPKKYKGEKLAIANYIIIGVLGVASTFYVIYLLFTF